MRKQTSYTLIGAFVITGAILLTGILLVLGARQPGEAVLCKTYMTESVSGLDRGSVVRFRGVKVGKVENLRPVRYFASNNQQNYIVVHFKIYNTQPGERSREEFAADVKALVMSGMRVRLASAGLTGTAYLEVDVQENWIRDYPPLDQKALNLGDEGRLYIPAAASSLKSLVDGVQETLDELGRSDISGLVREAKVTLKQVDQGIEDLQLRELSSSASSFLQGARQAMDTINAELPALVREIQATLSEIHGAAADARRLLNDPRIAATLANLQGASAQISSLLEAPETRALASNLDQVLKHADRTIGEIRAAAQPLGRLVTDARHLVQGKGRDLDTILRSLQQLAIHLNNLSASLEKYPAFALFGNPPLATKTRK